MPRCMGPDLVDVDAGALFDRSDAAHEEMAVGELGLEHGAPLGGHGDEQPARGLGVVAQHHERVGYALQRQMTAGEVAVSRVTAGANSSPRNLERAVDRRE